MEKYLFALPFALSVSCPGSLGDSLPHVDALKERLFRSEGCCVETRGWVHGFVVRLQETSLANVRRLIAEAGCFISEEVQQHYEWPESQSGDQHQLLQRQLEPWNALESHVDRDADEPIVGAVALEKRRAVAALKLHRPDKVAVPAA